MADVPHRLGLSAEQRTAVEANSRSVLVVGGPGTGKTHAMVARVAELVRRGTPPSAILVTTFGRDAAAEARMRLKAAGFAGIVASTFHSYAFGLIGKDEAGYGVVGRLRLWENEDVLAEVKAVVAEMAPMWAPSASIPGLVCELKERLSDVEALRLAHPELDAHHLGVLQGCHAGYERRKAQASALDYADMALMVARRMGDDDGYRQSVARGLQAVLVDEFQDLNPAQAALLDQLLSGGASLWAVGDDDQCLYGFRAADPCRLVEFRTRYPDALVVPLTRNRRSGPAIVAAAQDLIARNNTRVARPRQQSVSGSGGAVRFEAFDTPGEEAARVLELAAAAEAGGRTFAVLARAGWRLRAIRLLAGGSGQPAIKALTVHKAKGLQWDCVAFVGFEEGSMPRWKARNLEEERRIAYVGMTRARTSLHLMMVRRHDPDRWDRDPGPFWHEAQGRTVLIATPRVDWRSRVQVNDTVWIEVPGGARLVDRLVSSSSDFIDAQLIGKAAGAVVCMNPGDPSRIGRLMRIDKFVSRLK